MSICQCSLSNVHRSMLTAKCSPSNIHCPMSGIVLNPMFAVQCSLSNIHCPVQQFYVQRPIATRERTTFKNREAFLYVTFVVKNMQCFVLLSLYYSRNTISEYVYCPFNSWEKIQECLHALCLHDWIGWYATTFCNQSQFLACRNLNNQHSRPAGF